ncbi:unnamed protein product [Polarella glacialis]|uniref:Pseudouridine synthase RsuA/RluA-like domain-containing protein n=1 Tax=Polarella glacialis TaxID=89957 RepID=A0A813GLW8_POLGL|nr:unnamed protein product [Polarella glacialis]
MTFVCALANNQAMPAVSTHPVQVPELAVLLALGPSPRASEELSRALAPELGRWRKDAKLATVVLRGLAAERPALAEELLRCMRASQVEVNTFHCNAAISAFEKTASWQHAISLVCLMTDLRVSTETMTCNMAINACKRAGLWRQSLELLSDMPSRSVAQDKISFNSCMSACARAGKWHWVLDLLSAMPLTDLVPDAISYNSAISACAKGGQWQLSLELLGSMPASSVAPDKVSFGASLSACASVGQWQLALHLLEEMPRRRVPQDVIGMNAAISSCEQAGQWQVAVGLLTNMAALEVLPDAISFSTAISACNRGEQWQVALHLLSSMPQRRVLQDKFSYSATITTCSTCMQWQLAAYLLDHMPLEGIKPDEISYNAAIGACEKGGQWQYALRLLTRMPERALSQNVISYNAAIQACSKSGMWECALGLLSSMPEARLAPNLISFNSAISSCDKDGHWSLALVLLDCMSGMKVPPDSVSCNAAIGVCGRSGRWDLSLQLLEHMPDWSLARNEISCNAAISACLKGGRWQLALDLFRKMPEMRAVPNEVSCNLAIGACDGANWQLALGLLEEMPKLGLTSNRFSYSAAIAAVSSAGLWQLAVEMLMLMPLQGISPDAASYNACIGAASKSGRWEIALQLLRSMPGRTLAPNEISYTAALTKAPWPVAVALLSGMPQCRLARNNLCCKAAINVCETGQRWEWSLHLLDEGGLAGATSQLLQACGRDVEEGRQLLLRTSPEELTQTAWSLAKSVATADGQRTRRAAELLAAGAARRVHDFHPQDLAALVSSFASMAVADSSLMEAAGEVMSEQLASTVLTEQGLSNLAWAFATLNAGETSLYQAIQDELVLRADRLEVAAAADAPPLVDFAKALLGTVWACHFAGQLRESTAISAQRALQRIAAGLAQDRGAPSLGSLSWEPLEKAAATDSEAEDEPQVILELSDRLVVQKPAGWQVDDGQNDPENPDTRRLSEFLQELYPSRQWPILQDVAHQRGFLHRLDVPTSGLILVAKTHDAYYDLALQMARGQVVRDYVVLCHGWFCPARSDIRARVHWWTSGRQAASRVSPAGKPARSHVKILARATLDDQALSLLGIRIETGRRHQIRLHTAHTGHPTVCDGKYAGRTTFLSDLSWCPRTFLHRYRLSFYAAGAAGVESREPHEVSESLPSDLAAALRRPRLLASDERSAETWQAVRDQLQLKPWHDC